MAILLSTFLFINAFATSPVSARYNASSPFKLKAHVLTQPNPAFECLYLEPYHISPAYNYALLLPKTTENPGIIGHLNGTAADFVDENTDLLFDFSPGPYGFVIDQFNATYNPILIDAGNGTQGMFIDQGVIKYHNPISGGFYGESADLDLDLGKDF
ncbi:hypothetical protein MMC28_007125 [Mycoblastus sanguinarius]|nr:hypothetical protein [Mycoblastus sanguinarius]